MKKILILAALAVLGTAAGAQTTEELIKQDADHSVGIYHRYETFGDLTDTPAPRGYKPFYISHYGRHGSRYHTSAGFYNRSISALSAWKDAGILTQKGGRLLQDVQEYVREQDGRDGILTQIGSLEHQQIADRMYHRFPQVFRNRKCKDILVVSSTIQRCLQSAAGFTLSLKGNDPGLQFHLYTGDRYMDYLCHSVPATRESPLFEGVRDSILRAELNPDRFIGTLVSDPQKAAGLTGGRPLIDIIRDIYYVGSIRQDIEAPLPDILGTYFDMDELLALADSDNARWYGGFANSVECGDFRSRGIGVPLLRDFVEKADEVLAGGGRIADLRFGHDTGLAPLFFLLETAESGGRRSIAKGSRDWWCFRQMCMASNIQMVFYRNKAGDTLVKILHNESETTIPAVPTFSGPYYRWSDLRAYFIKLIGD